MGHSAGGGLAALLATDDALLAAHGLPQNPVRGAIMDDPAGLDMYSYLKEMKYEGDEQYLVPFGNDPAVWKEMSPIYKIRPGLPPFIFYIGGETYPSISGSSGRFRDRLKATGQARAYTIIPGRHHIPMVLQLYWQHNIIYQGLLKLVGARDKRCGNDVQLSMLQHSEGLFAILIRDPYPNSPPCRVGLLKFQQPLLAVHAAGVARQAAIGPNDAVAGPHDGQRVLPIGRPHGPHRFRVVQQLGHVEVGGRAAVANAPQRLPHLPLKIGAEGGGIGQAEFAQLAAESRPAAARAPGAGRRARRRAPWRRPLRSET